MSYKEAATQTDQKDFWNQGVDQYLAAEGLGFSLVVYPALTRHIGDVKGLNVLDYGCGNGRFSRVLERMAAGRVIGVDISPNMIAEAKKSDPFSKVDYYETSNNKLSKIEDCSLDIVVANFVFIMSPTEEDMAQSMKEIFRVLKSTGRLIYAITHPAFVDRDAYDYRNDFEEQIFNYMRDGRRYKFILRKPNGEEIDGEFYDYHYKLTTYINRTLSAGFRITGFEELTYSDDIIAQYNMKKELQNYPQSLIIACIKP